MSADACDRPLDRFYSVIPAGGIGSRLWPLSRADAPKFLHDLTGSGQTLLRDTWDRLAPLVRRPSGSWSSPAARTAPPSRRSCPSSPTTTSCSRASRKDSSAAIGLAAAILQQPRARRDHRLVRRRPRDHATCAVSSAPSTQAVAAADAGYIATIGITPTEPAIGFGYIHCGGELDDRRRARRAARRHASSRSPTSRPPRSTSPTAATSGTPACSSPAPTCCSSRSASREPELLAGLIELAEAWDTPRARRRRSTGSGRGSRRSRSTTRSPSPRRRRAGSPSSPATSTGTTSATSPRSPSCTPAAASPTSPSSARTPACSPTRRAAS